MTSKPSKIVLGDCVIGNIPSVCDNKKNTQQKNRKTSQKKNTQQKKRKTSKKNKESPDLSNQPNRKQLPSVHHTYFDDVVVESKPVLSAHAKDRLKQGRQGKYINKRSHNKQVIVTVLPKKYDFDSTMHEIPFAIKHNKKRDFNKELKDFAAVKSNYLH